MRHHFKAAHELSRTQNTQAKQIQSLSTGKRIHSAADDAARLARASEEYNRVRANAQAKRNAQDALSLVQTSSNSMIQYQSILSKMRELAVQASNDGTLESEQRQYIQTELTALVGALDSVVEQATYGSQGLLDKPRESYGVPFIDDFLTSGVQAPFASGINSFGIIPEGTENLQIDLYDRGADDDLQITTRDGRHLVGSPLTDGTWTGNGINSGNIDAQLITEANGYESSASYDGSSVFTPAFNLTSPATMTYNGMTLGFSGESNPTNLNEKFTLDKATEPLIITFTGSGWFDVTATWSSIPPVGLRDEGLKPQTLSFQIGSDDSQFDTIEIEVMDIQAASLGLDNLDMSTADAARGAITTLDSVMKTVEGYQAQYGRYENTLERAIDQATTRKLQDQTNLSNSQDANFAESSANYARSRINAETITSSLKSANYLKELYVNLIQGGMK